MAMTPQQEAEARARAVAEAQARAMATQNAPANGPLVNPQTGQAIPQITVSAREPEIAPGNPVTSALDTAGQFAQSAANAGLTFTENAINAIPIAGPALQGVGDFVTSEIGGRLTGRDPAMLRGQLLANRDQRAQNQPVAAVTGAIAGATGPFLPAGATSFGAQALGLSGPNLASRMVASGASGGVISGLDTAARGGAPEEIRNNTVIGAGIGGAIPGVGAGLSALGRGAARAVAPFTTMAGNTDQMAATRVAAARGADAASGQPVLSSSDEAWARLNNQPIMNVDRGGENTLALMRSAANQNPAARATVTSAAQDRFAMQEQRTSDFFNRVMGGNVSDLERTAQIQAQARAANDPAYRAAFDAPEAQAVWNDDLQRLMQSSAVQRAISDAVARGSNRSALGGFQAVRNPFVQAEDGTWQLAQGANGQQALPNLQFWNQVKINLDGLAGTAARQGDNSLAGDIGALSRQLRATLDSQVPIYGQARSGAMAFFNAEDAVQAGRNAWSAPKNVEESIAAFRRLPEADRENFAVGMIGQIMRDIGSVNNRSNLMRYFDVPARKEMLSEVLGPGRASQMEAFVRVEDIMDRARTSLGNSTTARQLAEMGLTGAIGSGGTWAMGGDLQTGLGVGALMAAGRAGYRQVGQKADAKVLQRIATLLASNDDRAIQQATAIAALSQANMQALEAIQRGIGSVARGSALTATQ